MLPLAGVKVVEIAQNLAGPFCGQVLAHLGAEVVKVERPEGGDDARHWGPPFIDGVSPSFHAINFAKRSIALDLKDADQVAWLKSYLGGCDVLVQNLRPGVLEELGLGAETITAAHPRLVYCSLWAMGRTGPRRLAPGYEPMVQAFSSLMWLSGEEGGPPTRMGTQVLDHGTGMWAAMGVLALLFRRAATGRGGIVDTSLFETALGWLTIPFSTYAVTGKAPSRHPTGSSRLVVFQGFETADGPIVIAAANDRLFGKLATALGRTDWAADSRFKTNADRLAHRNELIPPLQHLLLERGKAHWCDILEQAGVPAAPINTLEEMLADPQTAATGMVQPAPGVAMRAIALPVQFDGVRPPLLGPAPTLGQHTAEIVGKRHPD
ncbi:MAG: CoA transferase [Alphaproteobacteria bacterium]|nr:CoA transferase [Alphaproteobacteria bacterium]